MKILYSRGDQAFIVEKDGKFYLVNIVTKKCVIANPPDSPDMFLKHGYFEDANITASIYAQINQLLFNYLKNN